MDSLELKKWRLFAPLDATWLRRVKFAVVFGVEGSEALLVSHDDKVYGLGTNDSGCLGLGHKKPLLVPSLVEDLCGKDLVNIVAGDKRAMGLTRSGQLYTWGKGTHKPKLVAGKLEGSISAPSLVKISCSGHFALAVARSGEAYSIKQDVFFKSIDLRRTTLPPGIEKVKAASCGPHASLLLTDDGKVCQLDNGKCRPAVVKELKDLHVTKVACGANVNAALTREGHLYCWSYRPDFYFGQTFPYGDAPVLVNKESQVFVDVAASFRSALFAVKTLEGKVLVFGECLGQTLYVPQEVTVDSLHEAVAYYSKPPVTHEPIALGKDLGSPRSISQSWRVAFDDKVSSDLKFILDGQSVNVHKSFLVNRSDYFRSMLLDTEVRKIEVAVPLIPVPEPLSFMAFKSYLKYLYTDTFEATFGEASELLRAASFFKDSILFMRCQLVLQSGLQVENAATLFKTAIDHGARELEDQSFRYCYRHLKAVSQTECFKTWDDITSKRFIERIVAEKV